MDFYFTDSSVACVFGAALTYHLHPVQTVMKIVREESFVDFCRANQVELVDVLICMRCHRPFSKKMTITRVGCGSLWRGGSLCPLLP